MIKGGAERSEAEGLPTSILSTLSIAVIVAIAIIVTFTTHPTYAADSSSLGLSITPDNLTITAQPTGGITTGKQTIKLTSSSNYQTNYNLSLSSKDTNTSLLPTKTGNTTKLTTTNGTTTKPATALNNNEWGISLDSNNSAPSSYIGLPSSNATPLELMNGSLNTTTNTATKDITFTTKTTESTPADTYSINIVYTLTAEEILPTPTIDRTTPAAYQYGDNTNTTWQTTVSGAPTSFNSKTITIQGSNFIPNTTNVYIDINNNGEADDNEKCTNVTVATGGNSLTCNIPTEEDTNNPNTNTNTNPILTGNATNRIDTVYNIIIANGDANTTNSKVTKNNAFAYYASSICENANPASSCQVDIDSNMIPVKYTGNTNKPEWQIVTKDEISNNPGSWYNYENKQWANAVTLVDKTGYGAGYSLSDIEQHGELCVFTKDGGQYSPLVIWRSIATGNYKDITSYSCRSGVVQGNSINDNVIPESDILSYFTYTPRYAYEVMRPNAADKFVYDQNFAIKFEKSTDTKKSPASSLTCNPYNNKSTAAEIANTKDYRTECNIDRIYPTDSAKANQTTWATHPAFTWQYTKATNGFDKTTELNGIWVGKYETSGSTAQPTIKPNQKHIGNAHYNGVGEYYDIAKSMGKLDSNNTGGNNTTGIVQNNNNLSSSATHMLKNSEWGAIAYLSASKYGAGANGAQINSANDSGYDGNNQDSVGYTGCGPDVDGGISTYACANATDHQYQSTIGQLASTTNNPTGIYDMAGGAWEYVMGNRTISNTKTTPSPSYTYLFKNQTKPPYADLYKTGDGFGAQSTWSSSSNETYYSNDNCAWSTCAGQALNETKPRQAVSDNNQSWGGDHSVFLFANGPWSMRGGSYAYGSYAGLFCSYYNYGGSYSTYGFRAAVPAGL